jgi:hypothetical protein
MLCLRCWRRLPAKARFCEHCGLKTSRILRVRLLAAAVILIGLVWNVAFLSLFESQVFDCAWWPYLFLAWTFDLVFALYIMLSTLKFRQGLQESQTQN